MTGEKKYTEKQIDLATRFADAEAKLPESKKAAFYATMNAVLLGIEMGSRQAQEPEQPR